MRTNTSIPIICLALGHVLTGYGQNSKQTIQVPEASDFVSSPLRNSIKLELNATTFEVWALIGKLERMPEYSSGLKRVDAQYDSANHCQSYACTFFPMSEGSPETTHTEIMKWYQPNIGLASMAEEPNILGLKNSLGIIVLSSKGTKTILEWSQYFDADSPETVHMNLEGFKLALNEDIANNLIKEFGGQILESYVQPY
ncbi:MAG: hypothetical protein AB3N18_16300 [Allomuricauda sp.]